MTPPIIKKIEKETGISLKAFTGNNPAEIVLSRHRYTYSADENGNLTALNLCGKWKDDLQPKSPNDIKLQIGQLQFLSLPEEMNQLQYLNLSSNVIASITLNAPKLHHLDLSENPLSELIFTNKELPDLSHIDLNECQLTRLQLPELPALQYLDVSRNKTLQNIIFSSACPQLHTIDAADNDLQELSLPEGSAGQLQYVYLNGNKNLINPSPEIVERGVAAIVNYLKDISEGDQVTIYEAKLCILGDAAAGKTSLKRKTIKETATLPTVDETTIGVEVVDCIFPATEGKPKFIMHIWDFGGQLVYHTIHQFFLTKRSLYVLVLDGRKEEKETTKYWLQTQQLLCENSPLIIVANQKGDIKMEVPIDDIAKNFKNVVRESFVVNLQTNIGLSALKNGIEYKIRALPHFEIGEKMPKKWSDIRNRLQAISTENAGKDHITLSEYREVCSKLGITDHDKQDFVSDYLHDLGVLLHFREDAVLNKLVILKPDWATKAVYEILNHTEDRKGIKPGHFSKEDLQQLWCEPQYRDAHDDLLALMMKFGLCYRTPENDELFIVPNLLPENPPTNYKSFGSEEPPLRIYYTYDFMPSGIVTRLIVVLHQYIKDDIVWKRGVELEINEYGNTTKAQIREEFGKNKIEISVKGFNKRGFLAIIKKELDEINSGYHFGIDLSFNIEVPCNCDVCATSDSPSYYKEKELIERLNNDKETIDCPKNGYKPIPIRPLLDIFKPEILTPIPAGPIVSSEKSESKRSIYKRAVWWGSAIGAFLAVLAALFSIFQDGFGFQLGKWLIDLLKN